MSSAHVHEAEEALGYRFRDRGLLEQALTHPSAVRGRSNAGSYERLEFLGDSVLGAMVAHRVFVSHPDWDEGELTRLKIALISGDTLSQAAYDLGLSKCIAFGGAEWGTETRGMHSALENVFEAVVGALYLDGGAEPARAFVERALAPYFEEDINLVPESPKSLLQEITQRQAKVTPTYEVIGEEGPAHDPSFVAVAKLGSRRVGRGRGKSKKAAESAAAQDAIERIERDPKLAHSGELA